MRIGGEFADGQEFQDAILDLVQPVVVGIEDFSRMMKVEIVLCLNRPRQIGDPLEVGPDQVAIRGVLGQGREPLEFAFGLLVGVLGEFRCLKFLVELVHFPHAGVTLADFFLNFAHA